MADQKTLACYMNLLAFDSLPAAANAPRGTRHDQFLDIVRAGFQGVQFATSGTKEELAICQQLGLGFAGSGRINNPDEALPLAQELAARGYDCSTLHVGWGIEDDDEAHRLIESILTAAVKTGLPLYIETHRATICQDMWRTVNFLRRFPEIRFNGDFSHWYAGQEMVYGTFEKKLAFIQPVLERVRFIHGRIASPGCIQVPVQEATSYLSHFKQLWTKCFQGFFESATAADRFCFTPELLSAQIYYARQFQGVEESNRWEESLLLNRIAQACFDEAKAKWRLCAPMFGATLMSDPTRSD